MMNDKIAHCYILHVHSQPFAIFVVDLVAINSKLFLYDIRLTISALYN